MRKRYEQFTDVPIQPEKRDYKMTAGARLIDQAGEPRLDGLITPGEIVTLLGVLFLISVAGIVVGTAIGLLLNEIAQGFRAGCAAGATIGGIAVATRAIVDLWVFPRAPTFAEPEPDTPPERKGVGVWVGAPGSGQVKRGMILPELPESKVHEMLTAVAKSAIEDGEKISKRAAGRHFGGHFGEALQEMIRARLLVQAGKGHNAGYDLTDAGREWLKQFL